VKKIEQKLTPGPEYLASHFHFQILQLIHSRLGAAFCPQSVFRRLLIREVTSFVFEISDENKSGLSGEAL